MTLENLMQKIRASDPEPDAADGGEDLGVDIPDDVSDLLDADGPSGRNVKAREQAASSVRKRRGPAKQPEKLTVANKKKIKDVLIMMITLPGGALAMRDPVCGGALVKQAEPIADALVPIIARNPAMLRWFLDGGGWMDYMALMLALQPVGAAVWGHHITGALQVGEGGVIDEHSHGFTIPDA